MFMGTATACVDFETKPVFNYVFVFVENTAVLNKTIKEITRIINSLLSIYVPRFKIVT